MGMDLEGSARFTEEYGGGYIGFLEISHKMHVSTLFFPMQLLLSSHERADIWIVPQCNPPSISPRVLRKTRKQKMGNLAERQTDYSKSAHQWVPTHAAIMDGFVSLANHIYRPLL